MIEWVALFVAFMLGGSVGMFVMALFAARAYDRGHKDGARAALNSIYRSVKNGPKGDHDV